MDILYVKNGIANNYGDRIELNEHLLEYPLLHKQILRHELKHSKDSGFTKQDFIADFGEEKIDKVQLLKFMLKYPRTFWQLSPVTIKNKTIYYDLNMALTWGLVIVAVCASIFLSTR